MWKNNRSSWNCEQDGDLAVQKDGLRIQENKGKVCVNSEYILKIGIPRMMYRFNVPPFDLRSEITVQIFTISIL